MRAEVTALAATPTGVELYHAVLELLACDDLTCRETLELTRAVARVEGDVAAMKLTVVADLDKAMQPDPDTPDRRGERPGGLPAGRRAADELAPALGLSPGAASGLVGLARRLDTDLPATLDALADGVLDLTKVRVIAQVTRGQAPAVVRAVQARAITLGPRCTPPRLRAALTAEAARLDPDHTATAAATGTLERDVQLRPSPIDGCTRLVVDLPHLSATATWLALNTAARTARTAPGETRTLPQLRADTLAALLTGAQHDPALTPPSPAVLAALRVQLQVVVAADTLRQDDTRADLPHAGLPPAIPGVGPVDADTIRTLAPRVPWRRHTVDPTTGALTAYGTTLHAAPRSPAETVGSAAVDPRWARLLTDPPDPPDPPPPDHGHTHHDPPAALRRYVLTRDGGCVAPACHHGGTGCALDHTINYDARGTVDPHGHRGTTSAGNLGTLCERWHNAKTHGGWHLTQPAPGTFTWTSPLGRTYTRTSTPLLPGWNHHDRSETTSWAA